MILSPIHGYTHVLMCGDFNYPNINWSTLSCNTSHSQMFLNTIHDQCLFITKPTHTNTLANILDLVLTNEINNVKYLTCHWLQWMIMYVSSLVCCAIPTILGSVDLKLWLDFGKPTIYTQETHKIIKSNSPSLKYDLG